MKITAVLSVLSLWAAGTTTAHPLSGVSSASDGNVKQIFARDDTQKCGDHQYSTQGIQDASTPAVNFIMGDGQKVKGSNKRKYPKVFHNYDNEVDMSRTMCAESEAVMYEFPILRNGEVFGKGMDPSTDRIIVGSIDNGDAPKVWSICGLITHDGADGNKFVNCS